MTSIKKVLYLLVFTTYLALDHDRSASEIMIACTLGLIYMELMDKL